MSIIENKTLMIKKLKGSVTTITRDKFTYAPKPQALVLTGNNRLHEMFDITKIVDLTIVNFGSF